MPAQIGQVSEVTGSNIKALMDAVQLTAAQSGTGGDQGVTVGSMVEVQSGTARVLGIDVDRPFRAMFDDGFSRVTICLDHSTLLSRGNAREQGWGFPAAANQGTCSVKGRRKSGFRPWDSQTAITGEYASDLLSVVLAASLAAPRRRPCFRCQVNALPGGVF